MKRIIETPEDLRPGDKWLGMTVRSDVEGRISGYVKGYLYFEGLTYGLGYHWIQQLIDAGNNTVERECEIVEFKTSVRPENGEVARYCSVGCEELYSIRNTDVHVAVSKQPITAIQGEVVAEGEYRINKGVHGVQVTNCEWHSFDYMTERNKLQPGDTILVVRKC